MEIRPTISSGMPPLQLPAYAFTIQMRRQSRVILDEVRRQFVPLTPEEWVRQHLIKYLIEDRGVPLAMVAVEKSFRFGDFLRRADVVVHNRRFEPVLVAECKATTVPVSQASFNQIGRYNIALRAAHMLITNGLKHYCCRVDFRSQACTFLNEIPSFAGLVTY